MLSKTNITYRKGFTIVELLIVVVVIAILAAITIVAYNGITQRAKDSSAASAASQAGKKVALSTVDNNDLYPSSLSALAGVLGAPAPASGDTTFTYNGSTYEYRVSGDNTTYCLTTTTGGISYSTTQAAQTATKGSCVGHGSNGQMAITNYYRDPKPTTTSSVAAWDGSNTGMTNVNVASSWSNSGRANRVTFPSTISSNNGGPTLNLNGSYSATAGQRFTVVYNLRLVSGSAGIGNISIDRDNNAGAVTLHTVGGSNVASMNSSQTYRVYITFTADSAATSSNMRFYINITNKSSSATIEGADVDLYPGDYQPNRKWYSGDSTSWMWNGTANNSSSTGPAL